MLSKKHFLTAAWAIFIMGITLLPGNNIPDVSIPGLDKLVHFLIFGILMFLMLYDFRKIQKPKAACLNLVSASFIFCIGYGILIEVAQHYIPGRSFSVQDIMADSAGIVAAYFIFKIIYK